MTSRAAIYLRVSTDSQDTPEAYGLAMQEEACRRYAERAGFTVDQVYRDVITGTAKTRGGFSALLGDLSHFDAVIIFAVDRLARTVQLGYALAQDIADAGVELHSALEGKLGLKDDNQALSFGLHVLISDSEKRRITRRLSEGKRQKVRGGQPIRPLNGYGFKDGEIYEPQAQFVRIMFQKTLEHGTYELRAQLHEMGALSPTGKPFWDRDALRKIIQNPTYRGEYVYGNDRSGRRRQADAVTCRVPQIVPDELWYAAQRASAYRSTGAGRRGSRRDAWPLTGRLRCGECGGAMVGQLRRSPDKTRAYYYYRCGDKALSPHTRKGCLHTKCYDGAVLHATVREALVELNRNEEALRSVIAQPAPVRMDTTAAVREVDQQLSKARNAYLRGIDTEDEYAESKAMLTAQRAKLLALAEKGEVQAVADLGQARTALREALAESDLYQTAVRLGLMASVSIGGGVSLMLDPV
ncbi:recombinase family protein [Deinococcus altitudinis]|uniref:recombinase family protein n=1 Tax=Deinococcus altitudinis TaxID=468914 RepID=UPI003891C9A0